MSCSNEQLASPVAVILGAGRGTRLRGVTKGSPKALVDIAGTPALLWIIASLLKNGIRDYIVVVSPLAERSIRHMCNRVLSGINVSCEFVVQSDPLGPGHAMTVGLRKVERGRPVLVALCDTLFDEPLPFDRDWVGVAEARGVGAWCWAQSEGAFLRRLYDKTTPPHGVNDVLVGLYFFKDDMTLRDAVEEGVDAEEGGEIQISWTVERYMESRPVATHRIATWVDCGTEENWLDANEKMFRHRQTHELHLRSDVNRIRVIKDTTDAVQLACEVEWFVEVGRLLPDLVPSVHVVGPTKYESDYLEMNLLSSMYLYEAGGDRAVVDHTASLLTTLSERLWSRTSQYSDDEVEQACIVMYVQKPVARLSNWNLWEEMREFPRLLINRRLIENVEDFVRANVLDARLYERMARTGWIHGDLHYGNIMFDSLSRSFRLIDPRGCFGDMRGPTGDVYYDLAKLRHSYSGMYDAIVAGMFDLSCDWASGTFDLNLGPNRREAASEIDALIEDLGFDLSYVKLLEVGIFLSLIPLHSEDARRQIAFLVRALQLLLDLKD